MKICNTKTQSERDIVVIGILTFRLNIHGFHNAFLFAYLLNVNYEYDNL